MKRIRIAFDPAQIKQIAELGDEVDVLEVKNLDLEFLRRHLDIFRRFPRLSMHVQYLNEDGQPTTFNLANDRVAAILAEWTSQLWQAFDLLRPAWISFHLGFSAAEIRTEGCDLHNAAVSESLSAGETFSRIVASIGRARCSLLARGYKGRILLENLDYHPTGAYEHVCRADFIQRVTRATGRNVLLDLSHAIITAAVQGVDSSIFVKNVGLALVREAYVAAPTHKNGRWYDINQPFLVCDTATRPVRELAHRTRPCILFTLECSARLPEQLRALRKLLK